MRKRADLRGLKGMADTAARSAGPTVPTNREPKGGPNDEIGFVWLRSGPELRPSGVDKARRICRKRQRVCCGNTTASGALALQFGGSAARYLYDRHGALQYGGSTDGYRRDACSTRSGKLAGGTPAPLPGKNPPYTFLRNEPIWISRIFRWITFILRHL